MTSVVAAKLGFLQKLAAIIVAGKKLVLRLLIVMHHQSVSSLALTANWLLEIV
jgi:hypothetical protein